jgi:hypothetical protein
MKKVAMGELENTLEKLIEERSADTFLGSMPARGGVLIVLFSHRYNEDVPLLVTGSDAPRILAKVHEVLAGAGSDV